MSCSVRRTRARIQVTGTVRRSDSGIQDVSHERPSATRLAAWAARGFGGGIRRHFLGAAARGTEGWPVPGCGAAYRRPNRVAARRFGLVA